MRVLEIPVFEVECLLMKRLSIVCGRSDVSLSVEGNGFR